MQNICGMELLSLLHKNFSRFKNQIEGEKIKNSIELSKALDYVLINIGELQIECSQYEKEMNTRCKK